MNKLFFLCISSITCILIVIVLNYTPAIHENINSFSNEDCGYYQDLYNYLNKKNLNDIKLINTEIKNDDERIEYLDLLKEQKDTCNRHKAIEALEYSAYKINIVFKFACAILGLFNYLHAGNNISQVIGIIGIGCGIVGFVSTLVYVIYNGVIFTKEVPNKKFDSISNAYTGIYLKAKSNGVYLEWNEDKKSYVCIFYNKDNRDSVFIKFSDYGKKYLNYNKKYLFSNEEKEYEINYCRKDASFDFTSGSGNPKNFWEKCKLLDEKTATYSYNGKMFEYYDDNLKKVGDCKTLRFYNNIIDSNYKNIYDYWVTTIVFSCIILVLEIGLVIFGILLINERKNLNHVSPFL